MNKSDIIRAVAKRTGTSLEQAKPIVEATFDVISEQIKRGKKVNLVGFGTFSTSKRAARKGRNPQTGQMVTIRAKSILTFTADKPVESDPDETTDDPGEFIAHSKKLEE